jgi:RHS repeat-associated protein
MNFIKYKVSFVILIMIFLLLVLSRVSYAQQCIHSLSTNSIDISGEGGSGDIYLTTEECESYDAYTNDSWIYVWVDYYEQVVTVYADANHDGYREGTVIIHDYPSDNDYYITVTQVNGCEQLGDPGEISGSSSVCINTSANYSISPVEGASFYHWTLNGNPVSDEYGTTATISFSSNVYSSPATITVCGYNECGDGLLSTKSVTINFQSSNNSTSVGISPNNICPGNSTTLTINGGSLGAGASWKWYSGSCGGTYVGTGTSISVSPSSTTTYYVRAEGTCNTTTCTYGTVTVKSSSTSPSSLNLSDNNVCPGTNITLSVSGGSLGTGASWKWYSGSCGGTYVGIGTSISVSPSTTTTYYVRAEGDCNNTTCASGTLTIKSNSTAPSSINLSDNNVCPGTNVTLSVSGGSLGTGAVWRWYSGSCVGTSLGTGTSIVVNPSSTVTYYVKAEGDCNYTTCASGTLTIKSSSTAPSSLNLSDNNVCPGTNITLSVSGGSLGTGASWKWYSGSCGGTYVGTGTSIVVSPSSTTTYYVRAEGDCNNTTCASSTLTVKSSSSAPSSVNLSNNNVCPGTNVTLTFSGGSLGTGASWKWYSGSCGSTYVGTGTSVVVNPSTTTTYYVRAEGDCNNTTCASSTLTIKSTSAAPSSINFSDNNVCPGNNVTLSVSGGSLGTGASWKWYSGSCGGTYVGTGTSVVVSPSSTTTYYIRAEGDCNTTTCASGTLTIKSISSAPSSVSLSNNNVCPGTNVTLTFSGGSLGTGASWKWYSGSCGGTYVGTGTSISVSPSSTTTYYVRAEGDCNYTTCASGTLTVKTNSTAPSSVNLSSNNVCPGTNVTLTFSGGSLGTGASWKWYSGSCGGTYVGTGTSVVVNPSSTTTYYVRAEGDCNTTTCATGTLTVYLNIVGGVIAGNNTSCYGSPAGNITCSSPANYGSGSYTYSWQKSTDGGSSWTSAGGNSTGLNSSNLTATTLYRRQVTDNSCGSIAYSNTVTKTVRNQLSAGVLTGNQSLCYNADALPITGTSASGGSGSFTYTWEMSESGGYNWTSVQDSLASYDPPTMTTTTQFYRIANDSLCGSVYSNMITKTVYTLTPGSIGQDQTIAFNSVPSTLTSIDSASGSVGPYYYHWQSSTSGYGDWNNIDNAININYSPGALLSTIYIRRSASDDSICGTVYSNNVKLTPVIPGTEYMEGSEIPDPDNRSLNTSLEVGSTSGSVSTTQLGGLSYSIPLFCSPGTNGVQPALSLQYNSQSGNGLLGWGWNLGGLSSISRMVKPYYIDGEIVPINMVPGDQYALDGNRLVLETGGYQGAQGSKYKTELETFTETTVPEVNPFGPEWFEVKNLKDNSILEYGNAPNAYLKNSQITRYAWFLTKYKDGNGNYVKYNYLLEPVSGQPFLYSIEYTGNDSTNLQPYNQIILQYEKRSDSLNYYQAGVNIKNGLLISKIIIKCDGNIVKTYSFDYIFDQYSYLAGITETSGNGSKFNSTIFKYNEVPQSPGSFSALNIRGDNYFYFGDFNGDGRSDIIVVPKKGYNDYTINDKIKLYINQDGTNFSLSDSIPIWRYVAPNDKYFYYHGSIPDPKSCNVIDLEGDGKKDFCTFILAHIDNNDDGLLDTWENVYDYYKIKNGHFAVSSEDPTLNDMKGEYERLVTGDFNGDGIMDRFFYGIDSSNYNITITDKNNWYGTNKKGFINANTHFSDKTGSADFNGDGKDEIYFIYNNYLHVYEFQNDTLVEVMTPLYFPYTDYCLGDINGDGKIDILANNSNHKIFFSDGKTFTSINFTPASSADGVKYSINDINGDGKGDICESSIEVEWIDYDDYHYPVYHPKFYVDYFNGNAFSTEEITVDFSGEEIGDNNISFADFNGDGQNELFFNPDSSWSNNTRIWRIRPNDKSRLLSTVLDGVNNKSNISYGILPQSISYSNSSNSYDFPVRKLTLPIYLVENIRSYGQGETAPYSNQFYSYQDLRLHIQGKGLLGFSNTTCEDSVLLSKTETKYTFGPQFYNVYPAKTRQYINNTLLSETSDTNSIHTYDSGKRFFPYTSSSITKNKLNNTASEVSTDINEYGNLLGRITKFKSQTDSTIKRISESYSNFNSFGQPANISISSKRGSDSITRAKTLEYFSNSTLLKKETRNFGSSPSIITSYTYDNFGNPLTVTQESGDITRTNSNSYEPVKGRFIISKSDPFNRTDYFSIDPAFGNVLKDSIHSGLITSYDYNDFGKLIATHYPAGQIVYKTTDWSLGEENVGETYFERIESANKPTSISYFDYSGRTKRSKTQSFDGTYLISDNIYDNKGRLIRKNLPYFEGSSPDQYIEYAYDSINRVLSETKVPGNIVTSYAYYDNELKTRVTKGGQDYFKENEASGLLYKATDPGGTITYSYNAEDKVKSIVSPSGTTLISYNNYGYQHTLNDLDAGTITYDYNGFGELVSQLDANSNTLTMEYDVLGRMTQKTWSGGETISYKYNSVNDLIEKTSSSKGKKSFLYDNFNRVTERTDSIDGILYTASYTYNSRGDVDTIKYNSTVNIENSYNNLGYLNEVKVNNQSIWHANSMNRYGVVDHFTLGNQATTSIGYDTYGFIDSILTVRNGTYLQRWNYDFNPSTGQMTKRKGLTSSGGFVEENFSYDNLNRLTSYSKGSDTTHISYDQLGKGNIDKKSDVGSYDYTGGLHNVRNILNPTSLMQSLPRHSAEYTKFNKISYLRDSLNANEERKLYLTYGPDEQRIKTLYMVNNDTVKLKYFALGNYEKEIDSVGNIRELYYISSPNGLVAILQRKNNQDSLFYIHTDYLGSFDVVTTSSGSVRERYNFDPWGRRRNPVDWSYTNISSAFHFDRGFTGHEHLDQFDLINMNGRVYDPILAMFLSPDNYIQAPDLTTNFNRYTYCLNNPLIYSDPSGELIPFLYMAFQAAFANLVTQSYSGKIHSLKDGIITYGIGFIGSIAGFGASQLTSNINGALWGGLLGGSTGGLSGGISGGLTSLASGGSFREGFKSGAIWGGLSGLVQGGINGYTNATIRGANPWTLKIDDASKTYEFHYTEDPSKFQQPHEEKNCYAWAAAFSNPNDPNPASYLRAMNYSDGAAMYTLADPEHYHAANYGGKPYSDFDNYDALGQSLNNGYALFSTTDNHVVVVTSLTVNYRLNLFGTGLQQFLSDPLVMDPIKGAIVNGNSYINSNSIITWIKWGK